MENIQKKNIDGFLIYPFLRIAFTATWSFFHLINGFDQLSNYFIYSFYIAAAFIIFYFGKDRKAITVQLIEFYYFVIIGISIYQANYPEIVLSIILLIYFFKFTDYEMFFLLWSVVIFVFLVYNIFNYTGDGTLNGLGDTNGTDQAGAMVENMYASKRSGNEHNSRSGGGILDFLNLKYVVLLIGNIIGYIIVMPK